MEDDVQCRGPCTQIMMEEFLTKSITIGIYATLIVAFTIRSLVLQTPFAMVAEYAFRAIFFVALVSTARYNRNNVQRVKQLNLAIPICFSLSLVMHLFCMKIENFGSTEEWAFVITTLFNINQSSVIFFEMPRPVKMPLLILGFTSIIYAIEKQSESAKQFNGYLYPVMVVYTFFLAKIQCRCKTLKTQLIEELLLKNQNEKNTRTVIMETMKQGVVIMDDADGTLLYMNQSSNELIRKAIAQRQETQELQE